MLLIVISAGIAAYGLFLQLFGVAGWRDAVRRLTSVPARVAGLGDRGRIAVGYKADLNVIDHAALRLHKPVISHDLPAGGRRLDQTADGYVATIVSGEIIAENGVPTAARPGKLVRGRRPGPAPLR